MLRTYTYLFGSSLGGFVVPDVPAVIEDKFDNAGDELCLRSFCCFDAINLLLAGEGVENTLDGDDLILPIFFNFF